MRLVCYSTGKVKNGWVIVKGLLTLKSLIEILKIVLKRMKTNRYCVIRISFKMVVRVSDAEVRAHNFI